MSCLTTNESDGDINCNNALGTVTKEWVQGLEDLEIGGRMEKIQTTDRPEKRPRDSKKLAITQPPVRSNQLTLVWKTPQRLDTTTTTTTNNNNELKERQVIRPCQRTKNWGHGRGLEQLEIWGTIESIQTTVIVEIGYNTEKSPWELGRFEVTQTPVKAHRLMLK